MPLSILSDRTSGALADKICEQFSLTANSFCFAVTESVLREKNPDLPENVEMYKQYTEYFPDKAWIRAGTQEDYNEYLEKGKGAAFERLTEELTAIFGL